MRLLLDTQILVWMVTGDRRLKQTWRDAISDPNAELHVSGVIAFEFTDLLLRTRLPIDETMAELISRFDLVVEALPADSWTKLAELPAIHLDPVDRMLVAHALVSDCALITADKNIRRYPVTCI